jgi:sugar phosphate isomerase/epimerase
MNRRAYLQSLLSVAGVTAASPWLLTGCARDRAPVASEAAASAQLETAAVASLPIGAQLFTVRELLKQDPRGTLEALARIGFKEIELFGFGERSIWVDDPLFGMSPAQFKRLLGDLGLAVPTVHFVATEEAVDRVAAVALEIGAHHLIQAMAPDFLDLDGEVPVVSGVQGRDQILRLAESWNRLGEKCKRAGIGFAYHNHHMEFARLGDEIAYDVLLANSDPELVHMEMDIGWAAVAGIDGAEYLDRYPERFIACHLKDYDPNLPIEAPSAKAPIPEQLQLIPPGEGTIDFTRVLSAMRRNGIEHGYVEIDVPVGDPMDNCRRGYNHLAALQSSQGNGAETA